MSTPSHTMKTLLLTQHCSHYKEHRAKHGEGACQC